MVYANRFACLGDRLADDERMFEFGPGRHGSGYRGDWGFGSKLFAYAFDPSGNSSDFSDDIRVLPDDANSVVQRTDLHKVWTCGARICRIR